MSAAYLKWQRVINQLRFLYTELNLTKDISLETRAALQAYYDDFCQRHNIDLASLAKSMAPDPFQGLPGSQDEEHTTDTTLTMHDEDNLDAAEFEQMLEEATTIQKENTMHKAFYKIFKQLAMKLHPDRQAADLPQEQREENMRLFKEAKKALDEKRYFILLDLAQQYDIELPKNYAEQTSWMKKEIHTIRSKIHAEKTTWPYVFSECEDALSKDHLIKLLLAQLYNYHI